MTFDNRNDSPKYWHNTHAPTLCEIVLAVLNDGLIEVIKCRLHRCKYICKYFC